MIRGSIKSLVDTKGVNKEEDKEDRQYDEKSKHLNDELENNIREIKKPIEILYENNKN